ncbi:hypothetical protein [Thiorhodospira sibirica]|uniref:hypothetical protein n=1 Tax=Thiorhodospira sibirica TaxID=154347 RepID=UPI00022C5DC9|nr:hypothetical protein [Thiorhodospira sibirica]
MLHATSLTIGFNETEDRIVAVCRDPHGSGVILLLTRRLVRRLLPALTALLEHSSLAASKAPIHLRSEVILMEHQAALFAGKPTGQSAASTGDSETPAPHGVSDARPSPVNLHNTLVVVSKIDVTTHETHFSLIFQDTDGPQLSMNFDRSDLHRWVDLLLRTANTADWGIDIKADWVAPQHSSKLSVS